MLSNFRLVQLKYIYAVLLPLAVNVLDEGVGDSVPGSLPASGGPEHRVRP